MVCRSSAREGPLSKYEQKPVPAPQGDSVAHGRAGRPITQRLTVRILAPTCAGCRCALHPPSVNN